MPDNTSPADTHTFIVRLWREEAETGGRRWRGRVEHVASQEVGYVEDATSLVEFIQRWTGDLSRSIPRV